MTTPSGTRESEHPTQIAYAISASSIATEMVCVASPWVFAVRWHYFGRSQGTAGPWLPSIAGFVPVGFLSWCISSRDVYVEGDVSLRR